VPELSKEDLELRSKEEEEEAEQKKEVPKGELSTWRTWWG
jgi:hypothetical protein